MTNLNNIIAATIATWSNTVCDRVRSRWDNLSGIHGESHIKADEIQFRGTVIQQTIEAFGQKCFIAEYGSGSEAENSSNNPYLSAYVNSSNFNYYRSESDMTIRGRDAGTYYDLDGVAHESSGSNAGKDLELKPVYEGMTMLPLHVIEEECKTALPELYTMLNEAVALYFKGILDVTLDIYL
jgi:hypothetical protein